MSYQPQRPPLEHQNDSSYTSADVGSNGGHAPLLPSGYPPAVEWRTTQATGGRGAAVAEGGSGGKLRKPGWGKKDAEMGYEELDNSQRSVLMNPDGEAPSTKLGKLYSYLISVSIVTRWILFIVPMLGVLWIPGILSLTSFRTLIWGVRLIWWSIWLTVLWGGWWVCLAIARIAPTIIRSTIGVVAVSSRRYIDWMQALHRYIALFAWTITIYVTFQPIIDIHQPTVSANQPVSKSRAAISLIDKILFAFFLCSAVLLFEKFSIQWIAANRIADQKFAVRSLVTLYSHSTDIPGRSDTSGRPPSRGLAVDPRRFFKKLRDGVRFATTTLRRSVLQPNSPQAIIKTSLESANKSRLLARRLFYSFAKNKAEYLLVEDIERFFPTKEDAVAVFALFDKDGNGDASRDEIEMACLEFHREQLSIENSMRDLDSAVGRLDNILMSLYVIVAALIIAVALEAQIATLVTGAGTLVLGLSWLIGGSLQEVLTSIIFLFIKHPFDVGDRVMLNKDTYTVKEIRLLSTSPNSQLNTLFIQNIRRSPQMSETFTFDVSYSTSFEDLERLRTKMLEFVTSERRDYQPTFDVKVQTKMTLSADIKYKSNFQQAALKGKRRNKWICALKTILADIKIYGPSGDPNPPPAVSRYTKVPWDIIDSEDRKTHQKASEPIEFPRPLVDGWKLDDKNAAIVDNTDDVFGDSDEVSNGMVTMLTF
ncbi:hypothetical protein BDZ97DRAFT_1780386 [Flammula alnicola]|nr:hypothetical protein BDZ97DRAFT_1780386 [Flammula alnicola]